MAVAGIGLGDLILTAAREIRTARDAAAGDDPVLRLEGCELELKVTLSAEAGGGLKVWLLDLTTKGAAERASTIKLRFGPAGPVPAAFIVAPPPQDPPELPIEPVNKALPREEPP